MTAIRMRCCIAATSSTNCVRDRADLLVIAGLGAPNWDVSAAGDHANNFPLWGAMGARVDDGARAGAGAAEAARCWSSPATARC